MLYAVVVASVYAREPHASRIIKKRGKSEPPLEPNKPCRVLGDELPCLFTEEYPKRIFFLITHVNRNLFRIDFHSLLCKTLLFYNKTRFIARFKV